ncbi:MAG: bifunctional UDP-sugar hydrolase/5'-nucleotidase [Tissierellia bacterium]|nr:bifunctional UDP-sugar hydrolase/5'-nucleotidase [Tissierellia bacterium]
MRKNLKLLSLVLAFVMVLGFVAPNVAFAEDVKVIEIIHTNDVHGRAEGDDKAYIGYARLKTFVDLEKANNPNVLLVDAGDTLHGTTFATISRGQSMLDAMKATGYDLFVPGNHDFNYGTDRLVELVKQEKVPTVGANLVNVETGEKVFEGSKIIEVDGIKLGFFGLMTPETKTKSNPLNTEGYDFTDYIEVSKEEVAKLKEAGAQVVICLAHVGIDDSSVERTNLLAEKVEGIDLIVDGHSHTRLSEGLVVNDTVIVQTGEHLKSIGKVLLTFKDGKLTEIKPELVDFETVKDLAKDEDVVAIIEKINEENKPYMEQILGKTEVELDGERQTNRTSETNLGNLITDAMLEKAEADFAITNGGGIRASIPKGDVTMGHVLTTFPFTNYPVLLEIKGEAVKAALEHGVQDAPETRGGFPQVAGLTFKFDPEAEKGSKVFDVKIQGEPLDLEKTYKMVTNDFMAIGGDDYAMFKDCKKLAEFELLSELLADYIKAKGTIAPEIEGRIVVEKAPVDEAPVEEKAPETGDNWWFMY